MMQQIVYRDRHDAGKRLAERLSVYAHRPDVLVLGLPRGGVPVAYEVAHELDVPLDVFVVRKLGVPRHEETAMGAIAPGGIRVLNEDVIHLWQIPKWVVEQVATREQKELELHERLYRDDRPAPVVEGRTVILIDDGLATGATMRAALRALREQQPASLIVAVPVGSCFACLESLDDADDVVCLSMPEPFYAVGLWYEQFEQTSDEEIHDLLARAAPEQRI